MRISVSPKVGNSAARVLIAAFLASVATGCSSDVTRFSGLFSKSDTITTSSIQRRDGVGPVDQIPVPQRDVASARSAGQPMADSRQQALNQPMPSRNGGVSYDPVNTATANGSGVRMAATPVSVQRVALASPAAAASSERQVALAQPFPAAKKAVSGALPAKAASDALTTGTVKAGWSTYNAPSVTLKAGESVATLSRRFGVPEKEILKANGLKSAAAVAPGQTVVIPTFGQPRNLAKATAENAGVPLDKQPSVPRKSDQEAAVLPATLSSRDKSQAVSDAAAGKSAPNDGKPNGKAGGTYVVKPGDSLNKIAKATGVSVDSLKAANGLSAGSIRIGQALKLPGGADQVKTASIPVKKTEAKPAELASVSTEKKPESYKAPVAKETVSEVEKKTEVTEAAPESTGIGKYRWPVRGAVIAGYGANVEGSRNDGIDISVPSGTAIKAAENGVVIYAGNGLKELGNTVLVRHDDGTVTVYGHADALNVSRGQKVQRGQTLAASGMSGNAKRPQVHFEVRKDATPVNPMTFLE